VRALDPVEPFRWRCQAHVALRTPVDPRRPDQEQRAENDLDDRRGFRRIGVLRAEILAVQDEDHQQSEYDECEQPTADKRDRPFQARRRAQKDDDRDDRAGARKRDAQAETGNHGNQRRHMPPA
jgi:hypothetical protein